MVCTCVTLKKGEKNLNTYFMSCSSTIYTNTNYFIFWMPNVFVQTVRQINQCLTYSITVPMLYIYHKGTNTVGFCGSSQVPQYVSYSAKHFNFEVYASSLDIYKPLVNRSPYVGGNIDFNTKTNSNSLCIVFINVFRLSNQ